MATRPIIYVDEAVHKALKLAAVEQDTTMYELVNEILRNYLDIKENDQ